VHESIALAEQDGKLVIGPRELIRQRRVLSSRPLQAGLLLSGTATQADEGKPLEGPDRAVIQALCTLIAFGFLSSAKLSGVSEEFITSHLPEDYDGGVFPNDDGTLTLY
jgi:hypothetical protein